MHCLIAAIGKLKSGPEQDLFEHYAKRLKWKITVKEHEIKKSLEGDTRKEQEAQLLLVTCKDSEHIITLDEHGTQATSIAFADHLRKVRDNGVREIAFIIGGADGLHQTILGKAQFSLSFGRVTWPHMLVRTLLAEQLYRASTILAGHPYHRE